MTNIFMRFPGGKAKALTLSYDDGVEQDIRLVEIMNKHGLKGTFNLNSGLYASEGTVYPTKHIHRRMTAGQIKETFINSGQEIAVHALTHPFLEQLPMHVTVNEIIKDRENLEKQFGTIIRGMAYPFGTYNEAVIEALKACGIAYARTVISTNDFRLPKDWLQLTATCHHNSPDLKELTKKFLEENVSRDPYLFYLWGHSYEFEGDDNWDLIEDFASTIANRDDVWYATNIEIYNYIEAYHRLRFSADGTRVHNPSAQTIYIDYNGKLFEIGADIMMELN